MRKSVLIILIFSGSLFALNIDSAVKLAVANNYLMEKEKFIVEESGENLKSGYGNYKPKIDLHYTHNNRDKAIVAQSKKDTTLNATISYNLFNGFTDRYNIKSLKNLLQASQFTYEAKKQDLILEVKKGYIDYLRLKKKTETLDEAFKAYQQQYLDAKSFFTQGLIAKNELLEIEVEMLQSQQNLQNAISNQKIQKLYLFNLLGQKGSQDQVIEDIGEYREDIKKYEVFTHENRSEIKALQEVLESYKAKKDGGYGAYYPKVDGSLQYNNYGDDIDLSGRANYPDDQKIGTINISWNLYNGGKDKSKMVIYRKKIKQTLMDIEDLKQQLRLQYDSAMEQYLVAKLNYKTALKALEASKLNYEIVKNKLLEGLATNKNLIDANYLLTNAKQNYYNAYYDKYICLATLQRVTEK